MAWLLRSGRISNIFSDLRRVLIPRVPRYDPLTLHKTEGQPLCTSVVRLLSVQRPAESLSASSPQQTSHVIDRALQRIDSDVRRTGRTFLKNIEEIYEEIKILKHASSSQSLLLLRCCGSLMASEHPEVRNKLVQDIWKTLQDLGVPLDISHYNTLLRVYIENNYRFSPTDFLAQLESRGVEPNRVTYQRLITRYCQDGDIEGATRILEFMKEKQLPVGENIFNALIMGHARAKDMESAWAVLDVMRNSGLEPSSESYAALLQAYAETGDSDGLSRTLQECEAAELSLRDFDLLEAVYSLATHGHLHLIPQVMEKLNFQLGYTHDAMNVVYRLVNAEDHETAFQILSTLRVPQPARGEVQQTPTVGAFFIKHLVKSGTVPMTKVVEYCQHLKEKGLNPLALQGALQSALLNGRPNEALFLMRVMKDETHELRPHFFWPIIRHHAKNKDKQKVYDTVREMKALGVPISQETLRSYIFPGVEEEGSSVWVDGAIADLKEAGMSVPVIINAMVAYMLQNGDITEAEKLLSRYRVRMRPVIRKDLANIYVKTGQSSAAVSVLGQMLDYPRDPGAADREASGGADESSVGEDEESMAAEDDLPEQQQQSQEVDTAALFLRDVVMICKRSSTMDKLLTLMQEMEQRGISISSEGGSLVRSRLHPSTDADALHILDRLCSGDLTFKPLTRHYQQPYSKSGPRELEQRKVELENKNLSTSTLEPYLLIAYIRAKEVENAENLKKKLEADGHSLGAGAYVLLVDMYVGLGDLEKATSCLEQLTAREPDIKLTPFKYLRLALLMAQEGKAKEMIAMLEQQVEQEPGTGPEDPIVLASQARRLLEHLTENNDVNSARQVQELLLHHKVVPQSTLLHNPFIKYHLNNGDLSSAMAEFETICQKHNITPCKQDLALRCISLEDGDKLQKIMDLSSQVHGELNSLYDMVFAFLECGRVHQARKLVETPGLRAFNGKLDQKCKWFVETEKTQELADLVSITKDIFDIDRDMLYGHLLNAFIKTNDPDKALGVWTTMQEDNHQPSDTFLIKLGEFLQSTGRGVPFVMPTEPQDLPEEVQQTPPPQEKQKTSAARPQPQRTSNALRNALTRQFRQACEDRDWRSALNFRKQMEESGRNLSLAAQSELIEGLIKDDLQDDAVEIALSMVSMNSYPIHRVFKFLMINLSQNGKVEQIKAFEKFMTANSDVKRRISYDNSLCVAYVHAGRTEEALQQWTDAIRDTPDAQLQDLKESFPTGGIMAILEKQPHYLPQVMEMSEQYASRGITLPANCVWMQMMCQGQQEQADQIYQKHLKNSSSMLLFRSIIRHAERTGDTTPIAPLMQVLQGHPGASNMAKGLVYSIWMDVLAKRGKFEESYQVLENALKTVQLTELRTSSLNGLKEGLESIGKPFPHVIPPQESRRQRQAAAESSSSSSSSDSS